MMIGVPTVEVPPWPASHRQEDSSPPNIAFFHRFLPSNDYLSDGEEEEQPLVDAFTCDEFRMYEFKVRRCARGRSHDWTECPYAHPGEKARRRDPRKYHYSGTACPDFRKGSCRKGDACELAHGVFECWLHPSRYRTQPCKDGVACRRRVCFFAHTPEQLRVLPQVEGYDGSPMRKAAAAAMVQVLSPTSCLAGPVSPGGSPPEVDEIVMEMRRMRLCKRWFVEAAAEKGSSLSESSVDEPAWFSDIVS